MLNSMRYGEINEEDETRLRALSREVNYTDGIEPTELYIRLPYTLVDVNTNLLFFSDTPCELRSFVRINFD